MSLIIKNNDWQNIHQELFDEVDNEYNLNYLYVWSNDQKEEQWNWLIEYVTIYKEN